jgi:uncharacterized protein YndB with AHSA1/START domain
VRHPGVAVEIEAPASVVWDLLTDFERWPDWGPSIRRVTAGAGRVEAGVTGRVQTIVGVWVPFEITGVEPGRSWTWRVAGIPATRHCVSAVGPDRCRARFTVAWPFAPYLVVLRLALGRLERMAERP